MIDHQDRERSIVNNILGEEKTMRKITPVIGGAVPDKPLSLGKTDNLPVLQDKTGIVSRMRTKLATSRAAGEALRNIERKRIYEQASVELTAITVAGTAIRAAIVGNAMPVLGALITRLNVATDAVDQAITNGCAAAETTHLVNRGRNFSMVDELHHDATVTTEESEALKSSIHANAVEDIERSRQRMAAAKQRVTALHDCALKNFT